MSLLRAFPRPMASLFRQPARPFSCTACAREDEPNNATAELLRTMSPEGAREGRDSGFRRLQPSRDPAAPGAGGGSMTNAQWGRQILREERGVSPTEMQASFLRQDLEKQMPRRWMAGDIYAPHDISSVEASKWRRRRTQPSVDAFDTLALDPLKEYKNFSIMSEYMTEMGRIKHSKSTGLRPVNQRRVAKAIRRAIGIGIMPSVHMHPELIKSSVGQLSGKRL